MNSDTQLFTGFLKRNLPSMAPTFDEGIGIASERFFMAQIIKRISHKYQIKTVLEAPVDGLMGIPGVNSVYFAREGAKVTVASPSKTLLANADKFWQKLNLGKKVKFELDSEIKFPFKDNSFDLVWNYCVFERFKENRLLNCMRRVSRKYILIITQNKYNWGYPIHKLYHKKKDQAWDHGYSSLMDLRILKKNLQRSGLTILDAGVFDVPPWLDTFDMHTRGLGKKFVSDSDKWYWSSLQPGDLEKLARNKYIKFLNLFQKMLIFPLNCLFAHHFFVLAKKTQYHA